MPKRWATLPQGIRWLAGIAVVVLALAIVWALFVPAADWLAHHDVGSVTGSLHETALDNARGRLLTLGAGLAAAGALVFTARNFTLSREGQVTDRYTKAIEQLGSDKLDVRIGGIYALERVARDSARDHLTVMEVLTAFILEHSHDQWPLAKSGVAELGRSTRPDVQAAVTVIGRRIARNDGGSINLAGADLTGANLAFADLRNANLADAILTNARLAFADLRSAYLVGTNLTGADLRSANLSPDRTGRLSSSAMLTGADLTGADLRSANLTAAYLAGANLTGVWLAPDTSLASVHLTGATWPVDAPIPEGWTLDPGSGRLELAGTGSGPAEGD